MSKIILCDIDGTICDDIKNEESHLYPTAKIIDGSLEQINKWFDEGNVITFFTAREEKDREITENWLKEHGFKYHGLLMGKPRGGNYHWIDNHIVKATRYVNKWTELVKKTKVVEVFED